MIHKVILIFMHLINKKSILSQLEINFELTQNQFSVYLKLLLVNLKLIFR